MPGRRGRDCKVFVNMGADKSNLSIYKTSTFTVALLATQTFGQIVQNGGFESGKWNHSSALPVEKDNHVQL